MNNRSPVIRKRAYELGGGVKLELGQRTLIMGILNITPDSFSDGGKYTAVDVAIGRAKLMVSEGADILDIGGESTRPGYVPVSSEEELSRIIPVIEALREELPHTALSVDSYKADTMREALEAGAHIVNDIWGLRGDPNMAAVAAEYGCPVIIMHNRKAIDYTNFVEDVVSDLKKSIAIAHAAGIADEQIWIDPGIGFAKTYEHNLELMGALAELNALGYPVLLATSRKRVIRETLGLPVEQLVMGTAATVSVGIAQGAQMVRVHDVREIKQTVQMTDAIIYRALGERG